MGDEEGAVVLVGVLVVVGYSDLMLILPHG